mmetsp:Transcript_28296/g.32543  ORF Transcript_28296/g.32543 Transcript_28296/m.32543 type:complete len:388 (-) Transcript_28296:438-1601(-)
MKVTTCTTRSLMLRSFFLIVIFSIASIFKSLDVPELTSHSLLIPVESSNPISRLKDIKVLLLHVHLEGNLGDELETTPLLKHLHKQGAHVTAALSKWKKGEAQLHPKNSREYELVDVLATGMYRNYQPKHYDAIIVAPGPWSLCDDATIMPYPVDVYFGGSVHGFERCLEEHRLNERMASTLFVIREPLSYRLIQKNLPAAQVFMSGDLTNSYRPSQAAIAFWNEKYQKRFNNKTLVFSRANNFGKGVQIVESQIVLKFPNGTETLLPLEDVVFASSSFIEDADHFKSLKQNTSNLVMCHTTEQMFSLVGMARQVYTDRYHPGVLAHRLHVPLLVLEYKKNQIKLDGLQEISRLKTHAEIVDLNAQAFSKLDEIIRAKSQSKEATHH